MGYDRYLHRKSDGFNWGELPTEDTQTDTDRHDCDLRLLPATTRLEVSRAAAKL